MNTLHSRRALIELMLNRRRASKSPRSCKEILTDCQTGSGGLARVDQGGSEDSRRTCFLEKRSESAGAAESFVFVLYLLKSWKRGTDTFCCLTVDEDQKIPAPGL